MDKKQTWEVIVDITTGNCFSRESLPDIIGLDGRFTVEQLKQIIQAMEACE